MVLQFVRLGFQLLIRRCFGSPVLFIDDDASPNETRESDLAGEYDTRGRVVNPSLTFYCC